MKQYIIITTENPKLYVENIITSGNIIVKTTENLAKAIVYDLKRGSETVSKINEGLIKPLYGLVERPTEFKKINVDDLNGLSNPTMRLITECVSEMDVKTFSEKCEEILNSIDDQQIVQYVVKTDLIPVGKFGQIGMSFTCVVQYWGTEEKKNEVLNKYAVKSKLSIQ